MWRRGAYEELPGTNWSRLRSMRISPLQYKYDSEHAQEDTEALRVGVAIHCFVLEPERFRDRFCTYKESKSVGEGARKRWLAFQGEAELGGKVILSPSEYERAIGAGSAVLAHPVAATYFTGGAKEVAIQWTDAETGILCKGRADQWLRKVVELKSTRHTEPRLFAADAARMGYLEQLAFYHDGLVQHGVDLDDDAIMVTVGSEPPHDVVPYHVSPEVLEVGRAKYRELLIKLKHCIDTDSWPGVCDGELELEMPVWFFPKDDLMMVMPDGEVLSG